MAHQTVKRKKMRDDDRTRRSKIIETQHQEKSTSPVQTQGKGKKNQKDNKGMKKEVRKKSQSENPERKKKGPNAKLKRLSKKSSGIKRKPNPNRKQKKGN